MERLTIVLLTYNRYDYAVATIKSTLDNVKFDGELCVHIADDGSGNEYVQGLKNVIGGYSHIHCLSASNSDRQGYGANYNLAMQTVHTYSDFILPLEDDWTLDRELNASIITDALKRKKFGCVRMGYLGYTQQLCGCMELINGYNYFLIDEHSPEPHIFAGHPRIETKEWARTVGPWPEKLDPNLTEFTVAHYKNSRRGVAWPIDLIPPRGNLFSHIGAVRAR